MELVVVVPLDINCKSKGSPFKEIEGNGNQYPAHLHTAGLGTQQQKKGAMICLGLNFFSGPMSDFWDDDY